jgi:hypothetical protein
MLVTDPLEYLAYRGVTHQQDLNCTMAEKQTTLVESRDGSSDDEEFTWTEEEEKALVRRSVLPTLRAVVAADMGARIDLLVMPLLIMGFFVLQLDRGNMYSLFSSAINSES